MTVIIAVLHVLGSIVALSAFVYIVFALANWELSRSQKLVVEELSISLGIPTEHLDDAENAPEIIKLSAAKFSSDLLRNRLSDLCGWIQVGWMWIGVLFQYGLLIGVIWYSFTDSSQNAVYAWGAVGIAIFFWISSLTFGYICKLFTGRFPGQARLARKKLAELVKTQSSAHGIG